jgi:hypothetical protein
MDSTIPEIPVTLRLNRWEAKDLDLIPEKEGLAGKGRMGLKDVFEQRRTERRGIKGVLLELVKGLEESEIMELFGLQNGNGGNAVASGSGSRKKDPEDVVEVVDGRYGGRGDGCRCGNRGAGGEEEEIHTETEGRGKRSTPSVGDPAIRTY